MTAKHERGFTLVELVVVIVILGILAATALPKFIDLSSDASTSAIKGVAGGLASAAVTNYAARKANATLGVAVANCTDVGTAMQGGLPSGYTIGTAAVAVDTAVDCTLTKGTFTATFSALGIT